MERRPRFQIRPLGGGCGCVGMILISVVGSIVATILLNLLLNAGN